MRREAAESQNSGPLPLSLASPLQDLGFGFQALIYEF